ncbi:ABC transporter ATP-binding protein [Clostridium lundense]|uniref:ABC transporter ATP-binding protein n=1 Tax=Clostridium lundense TaxID=319475 RepID=UPI00047F6E40|nr:ABC transporter ATP-binding protein [Clostridium lundense]
MKLEISNLTKLYNKRIGLNNFSIVLKEGIVGVMAPNGSGKTTLLKILATVMKPTSGSVYLNGEDIFTLGKNYREIIGYIPQNFGVYPNFTAEQFLKYFGILKGIPKKEMKHRVDNVLNLVHLTNVKDEKLKTFSGGMQQRVGIAVALLNDPKILILDEPTVGLDPDERIRFRDFLVEISENKIIILSTHIVSDIDEIASDIIFMKKGELITHITPQDALLSISNKVYEVVTDLNGIRDLKKNYIVSKSINKKEGLTARIVGEKPCENAIPVEPTLEDVYMYYYKYMD